MLTHGSRGPAMRIDRPCTGIWFGQGVDALLIRYFVRRRFDRLLGRRYFDGAWQERRLIGIQDNRFRPFALGCDPDGRPLDDVRPIEDVSRGFGQKPASNQQKSS
jgi:hypothetical protein